MVAKISCGTSFSAAATYDESGLSPEQQLRRKGKSELVCTYNLLRTDAPRIGEAMEKVARQSRCQQPVWHISLSAEPGQKLTNDQWKKVTETFLKSIDIDIKRHQIAVWKHSDTPHDHAHILANAVPLDGRPALSRYRNHFAVFKGALEVDAKLGAELPPRLEDKESCIYHIKTKYATLMQSDRKPTSFEDLQTDMLGKHRPEEEKGKSIKLSLIKGKKGYEGIQFQVEHKPPIKGSLRALGLSYSVVMQDLAKNREAYEKEIEHLKDSLSKRPEQDEVDRLRKELENKDLKITNLTRELGDISKEFKEISESHDGLVEDLETLKNEWQTNSDKLQQLQTQLATFKGEKKKSDDLVDQKNQQLKQQEDEIKKLKDKLQFQQAVMPQIKAIGLAPENQSKALQILYAGNKLELNTNRGIVLETRSYNLSTDKELKLVASKTNADVIKENFRQEIIRICQVSHPFETFQEQLRQSQIVVKKDKDTYLFTSEKVGSPTWTLAELEINAEWLKLQFKSTSELLSPMSSLKQKHALPNKEDLDFSQSNTNNKPAAQQSGSSTRLLADLKGERYQLDTIRTLVEKHIDLSKDLVSDFVAKQIEKLLNGQKTDIMYLKGGKEGRLNVVENAQKGLRVELKNVNVPIKFDTFIGHTFTPHEKNMLREYGDMGKVVDMTTKDGEAIKGVISQDPDTGKLRAMRTDNLELKDLYRGHTLTADMKEKLLNGESVKLKGLNNEAGDTYDAYIRLSANESHTGGIKQEGFSNWKYAPRHDVAPERRPDEKKQQAAPSQKTDATQVQATKTQATKQENAPAASQSQPKPKLRS